jgi:hypothetical protein
MKPLTRILLLVALAALPLLAMTGPAQGAKKMEVAIQNEGVFLYGAYYDQDRAYQQLRQLGATHLRMNVFWHEAVVAGQREQRTKPGNVQYDFSRWDGAVAKARSYGIKVQFALTGDPPVFACGRIRAVDKCNGFKPDRKLYADFVRAAVAHFRGRVSRFSMWNEPNWYTWISPHRQAPRLYRRLYQAGYKAAKRANRNAEVVMGELAPHFQPGISNPPLKFIREMVCVNKRLKRIRGARRKCPGKLKLDAFATHPYDFEHRPTYKRPNKDELTIANIGQLPKLLNKLRKKGLIKPSKKKFPIYLTEHGYMVADNPNVRQARRRIPEGKRARWIVQSWKIAQRTPRIKQNLHFGFISPPVTDPSGFFDMGLIKSDGTIRGSFTALQSWIREAAADGKVKRPGPCSAC